MATEELLKRFFEVVADPYAEARRRKQQGQKVIGCLLTDVPEELIHAAGAFPVSILGANDNIHLADAHLQTWACSLMRSCLEQGLNGTLDFLDGIIIPITCDTTRMMPGIWRHVLKIPYIDNYLMPRQVDRPSARTYLKGELLRLKNNLEGCAGQVITNQGLNESINIYNANRLALRRLYEFHAQNTAAISSRALYTVLKAAMFMDKAEHTVLVEELLSELTAVQPSKDDRVRLAVSGGVWEPPEILDMIEELGAVVVADDFLTGARYLHADIETSDDLFDALAVRQLNRIPFGGYDSLARERRAFLVEIAEKADAHGMLFLHLKFCEPENYDYKDMREAMNQAGIPNIRLETEYNGTSLGQARTRLQAFIEMIGGQEQ
jgi:bcr-type benzoyl-CoA reductase subunit C